MNEEEKKINRPTDDDPSSTEESKTVEQPQTENLTLQTENMEVQKHPHHVTHKKNWGEYLLEFFMLFLAVFLGFVAENIRETTVEHEREKQFIQSYVEDLKSDTAAIRLNTVALKGEMHQMDSLMLLLCSHTLKGHENELYFFGRQAERFALFQSNDRTISQLKGSGSLRLIRNEDAADSIIVYQKLVDRISGNQNDERDEKYKLFPVLNRMFNPFVFDKMVTTEGIKRPTGNPTLRSYDVDTQLDLAFGIHQIRGSLFLIEVRLKLLNEKAKNLIKFLQKEYHLENE